MRHELSEKDFLSSYKSSVFDRPNAFVDTVIFTVLDNHLQVLIAKRSEHPFKDSWSLIGGYIDVANDKNIESTARRKLEEKTGIKTPYLEQYGSIGNQDRDPRGWSITTVYFALITSRDVNFQPENGVIEVKWSKITAGKITEKLAFDHADILSKCTERLRSKVLYTSIPIYLLPKNFTLSELQRVYEIILGKKLDPKSFRRRMLSVNIIEETDKFRCDRGRPAILYRLKESNQTYFFARQIEGATI